MNPDTLLWLIPGFPLLGALVAGLLALGTARTPHGPARPLVGAFCTLMPAVSFALSWYLMMRLPAPAPGLPALFTQTLWQWLPVGEATISLSLMFDRLTALMLLFVTGVGTLIHCYSIGYMGQDRGFVRFMAYLNLFMVSMIVLVMGASLPVTFLGWEGVGLCSYLLIGFWHRTEAYNDAARKAFVMNRVGDLGFLLGAFALLGVVGSLDYQAISAFFQDPANAGKVAAAQGALILAALLLFFGCTGKSAQIPLVTWLPDAMAGPTPVSALIHAATMVTAGVYLVARLGDLFAACGPIPGLGLTPLGVVLVIGCATALWGAIAGCFQNDIKKALAYSTVSQLGLMFMAAGVGAFDVALFHVFTHAFFKATLFLGAGAVIHGLHHEQDMRRMGGLRRLLPVAHLAMCYGWFAIIGGPLSSGFMSKDLILERLGHAAHSHLTLGIATLAWITALLTAFYMTRLMVLTFWSPSRVPEEVRRHPHGTPLTMALPLVVLGFLSLMVGFLWTEQIPGLHLVFFQQWLAPVLAPAQDALHATPAVHDADGALRIALGATAVAAVGVFFAWLAYRRGPLGPSVQERPQSEPGGFGGAWTFGFDRLYQVAVVTPVKVAGTALYWVVELILIGLATQAVAAIAGVLGDGYAALQRARLRANLALAAAGLVGVILFLVLAARGA